MLGFPTPYPEELLYSTIARAGVHAGETSPKQLLDQVFANRKVIATVDLPCHVRLLAAQYPEKLKLSAKELTARHTLLPIYAPFLPRERVGKLQLWMAESSQGATHLASGIAASRVKAKSRLYVCKGCLNEQEAEYGECYWQRFWQVPLIKICPRHGPLSTTNIVFEGEHRHRFVPVEDAEIRYTIEAAARDEVFAGLALQLLEVLSDGIGFDQWSTFYRELAKSYNFVKGPKIHHIKIHDQVVEYWGNAWLSSAGIAPDNNESSWLRALFRKHRKSFSFAEHIVAIAALSNGQLEIGEAIARASNIVPKIDSNQSKISPLNLAEKLDSDQLQWKQMLKLNPPQAARRLYPALYARLYRNHHDWLLAIDDLYHSERVAYNRRVDWLARDREIAKEIRRMYEILSQDLNAPHLSRTYLIHQLHQRATIEKNLDRLPRCSKLLSLYSESTSEYQARRLARAYLELKNRGKEIKRWSLLKQAGLSDERMTDIISALLRKILGE